MTNSTTLRSLPWLALAACLATALVPTSRASAQQIGYALHVEPGLAIWLDNPQANRFKPGFYGAIRPSLTLGRFVSLQLSYAVLFTPNRSPFTENGVGHFFMGGVRVRPLASVFPTTGNTGGLFADVNLGYVRTDNLNRFAYDIGIGYGFQVTPSFSIGPYLRYVQIVQSDDTLGEDPNDAQLLVLGVDIAFGFTPRRDEPTEECTRPGECECDGTATVATAEPVDCVPVEPTCADADRDGLCNEDDHCPTQIGLPATFGCPIDPCSGRPLMVLVQFSFDSSQMPTVTPNPNDPQTMDPVLEAVAAAVLADPTCRVCVIGYASEEGASDHNMTLSSQRAGAVQHYMMARGLDESRIPATGLGDSCQLVPEQSRVLNRRVEFRRLLDGASCPTTCAETVRRPAPAQP
jgi:hypothetical protein